MAPARRLRDQPRPHRGREISPIPAGGADLILAFEPAEALRNLHYLKPGAPLCGQHPRRHPHYLRHGQRLQPRRNHRGAGALRPSGRLGRRRRAVRAARLHKALNTVLLGVALREGLLPFTAEDMAGTIRANLPEKFHKLNLERCASAEKDG